MTPVIELKNIVKSYGVHLVLNEVSLTVHEGEFVALMGRSGSGKSTLLNIIGLLDKADEGELCLFGEKAPRPHSGRAQKIIRDRIGFVFQNYALLPDLSLSQNIALILFQGSKSQKKARAKRVLELVGMEGMENKKAEECSGGEQQRAALARIIAKECQLVLADEPTGNLDTENRDLVVRIFKQLQKRGKTIVAVTHDPEFARHADRIIDLSSLQSQPEGLSE